MIALVVLAALFAVIVLARGQGYLAPPTLDVPPAGTPPEPLPTGAPEIAGDPHDWDNQIIFACMTYGLTRDAPAEYVLVKAIIRHESGFNETVRGDAGSCQAGAMPECCGPYRGDDYYRGYASIGLMQINRCANGDAGGDLRNGNENILVGVRLLKAGYDAYWPDWRRVAAAYNGPAFASLDDWETNPSLGARQVRRYADRIEALYRPMAAQAGVAV